MSELWKRKARKYFSTFDLDSDGIISRDDFVGLADNYSKFGNPEKQKVEHLKTQFEKIWELYEKNAEIGNRDTITTDELVYALEKLRYDKDLTKHFFAAITDFHDMLDTNRDGYVQADEYERMLFQLGVLDQSFVKVAFDAIDVNGDGKLSLEEFINAYLDFMYSDDEKSPNVSFFGPLDG